MVVQGLAIDDRTQTPVVLLKERDGTRMLPIWIGPSEASAIAIVLAQREFQRPLTHDLLRTVIECLGATVPKIAIVELQDKTYFAQIFLARDDERFTIDARPSDSIALALRTESPIYVNEELLREDDGSEETVSSQQSMEELQRALETMDPEEFGKLWT
jgi:bifunctional DNase/RNase